MSARPARKPKTKPAPPPAPSTLPTVDLHEKLLRAIRVVAMAASTDEARGVLCGVHVVGKKGAGRLIVEASDSYRAYRCTVGLLAPLPAAANAIIPADWLKAVEALCRKNRRRWPGGVYPTLHVADDRAHLVTPDEERSIPLVGGGFPLLDKIIDALPAEHHPDQQVGFDPRFFINLLRAVQTLGAYPAAVMKIPAGGVSASRIDAHNDGVTFLGVLMPLRIADPPPPLKTVS